MLPLLAAAIFAAAPSWHAGHGPVHACVGVPASRCVEASSWAATVRLRDCANCLPHRTLAVLPANGIVLQLTVAIEHSGFRPARARWPIRIDRQDIVAGFEGISARYGVFNRIRRIGALEVSVWAFFGRAKPTAAQLARADAELARVRLPR
jgi:hypothetical protein